MTSEERRSLLHDFVTDTPPAGNTVTSPTGTVTPPAGDTVGPQFGDTVTPPAGDTVAPPKDTSTLITESTQTYVTPPATEFRKAHAMFLPVTLLIYVSVGIGYFTTQQWIQHYVKIKLGFTNDSMPGCNASKNSTRYKDFHEVERQTAQWSMYVTLAAAVPSIFATAIVSSYSDSVGRKFLFILFSGSTTIRLTLCSLAIYFKWDLIWIVVAIGLDGLTGSTHTSSSAAMAYLADLTSSGHHRTIALTINDGFHMLCVTLSLLVGGVFVRQFGFLVPMIVCAGMACLAFILTLCFLPESHGRQNRSEVHSVCKALSRITDIYTGSSFNQNKAPYIVLIICYFFQELVGTHRTSIEILYQLGQPFCWGADKIGVFSAARHATQGLAGIVFIVPLKRCMSESYIAAFSAFFNTGSFILEALAKSDIILFLVPVLATFGFLAVPMFKSLLSRMTPADKQGSLFASIVAVQCLCGVVASFLFSQIYRATVTVFHGFVFLILAGLAALVLVLVVVYRITQSQDVEDEGDEIENDVFIQSVRSLNS
ncbi:solute carrier family 46 member 3-like [Mya arenaria]|uniref:solute carrier family 46 member 3-like n=1 Tax=Mya arenaria TaxID=6604 RepID=UPI0022DEB6AE|nr:solute carrier family 46 member 3-like [Mya arenaria]